MLNDKTLNTKNELLQWILDLEDEALIREIFDFKKEIEGRTLVSEPQTEYLIKDDFEERWEKGLNLEQSRAESKRRIREWWGK